MNRKQLLAFARANGYKGAADLTALKKFLADKLAEGEEIKFVEQDGSNVDLDAAWATLETKSHVSVSGGTDATQTDDAPLTITNKDAEAYRAFQKAQAEAARAKGGNKLNAAVREDGPGEMSHKLARKRYEAKIATGAAVFHDADGAENFGAGLRLALCKMRGDFDYGQKANDMAIVGKTAVTTVNTAAGYLIPQDYVATLIYLTEKYGVARKLANVVPMSRDTQERPRKTAIITMSHGAENTAPTAQDNTYGLVKLTAGKVIATMVVTNEMLEDSAISVADDLAASIAEAYAITQDNDYFNGDGTSTYGGFVGLTQALPGFGGTSGAYTNGSGSAWSSITAADLDKLPGLVENVDVNRCCFVSSRQFYYQRVAALDTAASQFKALAGPGINGSDASYKGWPWYFSQKMQTTSASGKRTAYFGDFQAASMIGERRDLTVASSEHANFTSDAMTYRATARYAINIHGDGRGSTYGPIVALLTQ